jgi:hypothetical protein
MQIRDHKPGDNEPPRPKSNEILTTEQTEIRARWQKEFDDGARCAFLSKFPGEREAGGYPSGFHAWTPNRLNAWFAGFNRGFHDRLRLSSAGAR